MKSPLRICSTAGFFISTTEKVMNIDFAAEDTPAGVWWREDQGPPPGVKIAPPMSDQEHMDFGSELTQYRIIKDFNDDPAEAIDVFDKDDEARQDALLSGLTNMAYSSGRKPLTRPPESRRAANPFFYYRTQSFSEAVGEQKATVEPQKTAMEHIDQEVEDRLKTYERELSASLEKNIAAVREFFLTEIDPLSLGIQGGTAQVHSLMTRIFPDGIDTEQFMQFVHMAKQARKIKMANFIAGYMNLDPADAERIADTLTPKKEVMIIGPNADERISQQQPQEPTRKPRTRERIRMAGERERALAGEISARAPRGSF
jgi:hypothetical protein